MSLPGVHRRLAAILAADVVGYSRLMGEDEAGTLAAMKAHREGLIEPQVAAHDGRIVKLMGDGVLAEFASALEAVCCAVEIQRAMAERNADLPEGRQIHFRIGINLGDVISEGDDIYGDGINVAARLERLARPGGICLSSMVHVQIQNKMDLKFQDLGERELKNIAYPVHAFSVLINGEQVATDGRLKSRRRVTLGQVGGSVFVILVIVAASVAFWFKAWEPDVEPASVASMAFPLPEKPSIAVLPFDNLSGEPEQGLFADGITDDLITDLSKVSGLFVIARNSTFVYKNRPVEIRQVAEDLGVRYVMEGSVRRAGDTVRINAQLIDATTGGHIWADRFDGAVEDIFRVQDEFVRKIVDALAVNLLPEDAAQIGKGQTSEVAAREAFQKGWELYLRFTPEDNLEAIEHLERATELDPEYGRAYALLALIYWNDVEWNWFKAVAVTATPSDVFEKVRENLELAKKHPTALGHVAATKYAITNERHEEALDEAQQAIALGPNEPEAYLAMAMALITSNKPRAGLEFVETAFRLNPERPAHYYLAYGMAYFALGELEKAAEVFEAGVDLYPAALELAPPLASTYAWLGRTQEARQELLRWRDVDSQFLLEQLPQTYYLAWRWPSGDRRVFDRLYDGLYAAALSPETTVSSLIDTMHDGDIFQRLMAIQTLGRLGSLAVEAVPMLISELSDEEETVRKEVAISLGKIGPAAKDAVPPLEAIQDQPIVGAYAKEALKSIRGE